MMLLLRSKKQDLMQLYEQSRKRSSNSLVCSERSSSSQSSSDIQSIEEFENFIKESLQTYRLNLPSFPSTTNVRTTHPPDTIRFSAGEFLKDLCDDRAPEIFLPCSRF